MTMSPPLRSADCVMRLSRLGAAHMSRLSFSRSLLRRARRCGWAMRRARFDLDRQGYGAAVYAVDLGGRTVSLVAFSHHLAEDMRSDRVIATAWDTTFVLYDGVPDDAELARLRASVPLQEAGRFSRRELILARANKSVRSFEHVVSALAEGRQPEARPLREAGYLLRTSAVYGNGKFGIADHEEVAAIPGLEGCFTAEMLTVWLIRSFSVDLAEHCAGARAEAAGGRAARLSPALRRDLGVGNATGLGMAPFIVRHPVLLHRWVRQREKALAEALIVRRLDAPRRDRLAAMIGVWGRKADFWVASGPEQIEAIEELRRDLPRLATIAAEAADPSALLAAAEEELGAEARALTISLLIDSAREDDEDDLAAMAAEGSGLVAIDGAGSCREALDRLREAYDWALRYDFAEADADARFWYTSQEKAEPRIGWRDADEGDALELPLGVAREIQRLAAALAASPADQGLDAFLARHPEHRQALRRFQVTTGRPYAEIRDNLLDATVEPQDLMRTKLAFLGADLFDPGADMGVRVRFFQGAPYPDNPARDAGDGLW
ncbi:MAG: hypothetical protein ACK5MQ_04235 [Pikeienuella sp.]